MTKKKLTFDSPEIKKAIATIRNPGKGVTLVSQGFDKKRRPNLRLTLTDADGIFIGEWGLYAGDDGAESDMTLFEAVAKVVGQPMRKRIEEALDEVMRDES